MTTRKLVLLVATVIVAASFAPPGLAAAQADDSGGETDGGGGACDFPYETTDATGTEVTVDSVPERVVALQPSDAQTMWDIGARDQVVGMPMNQYTSYLDGRANRTDVVNDDGSVDVEVVTNASADLVLAANTTSVETVTQLRRAGLTVYHFGQAGSIEDVVDQVSTVGRLTGNCEGAAETVAAMESTVETVQRAVEGRERPRVLYYFFQYTTGSNTHIHDLIRTAGGANVAAEAGVRGYQPVSNEIVAASDPEWIVYPSDAQVPSGEPYDGTTAIRQNQTLVVNTNYVSQPGPRIVRPLRHMAMAFHPDAFPVDNATTTVANQSTTTNQSAAAG